MIKMPFPFDSAYITCVCERKCILCEIYPGKYSGCKMCKINPQTRFRCGSIYLSKNVFVANLFGVLLRAPPVT